jgi:transposase
MELCTSIGLTVSYRALGAFADDFVKTAIHNVVLLLKEK